ncbi:unnamed protein product [Callosobruchus maculatus]|uniref:Uncharacterized protein n=1 Tax=Callosobruchus maculatus TaxID=64391 RepID=A0A653C3M8_CALMS|nr:unnamed protein product [Callosobruchus maculatus]
MLRKKSVDGIVIP